MKTEIYKGYGWGKSQVGICEDGTIYAGYGWNRSTIGSYEHGGL